MISSRRQRVAEITLPAFLVLAAYAFLVLRPSLKERALVEQAIQDARKTAPTPSKIAFEDARAVALAREAQEARASAAKAVEGSAPPAAAPDASRVLTALLRRHGLVLEREVGSTAISTIPPSWRAAPGATERLRTVEVSGRFLGMLDALRAMQSAEAGAVPLRLSMRRSRTPGAPPEWTLTLWI